MAGETPGTGTAAEGAAEAAAATAAAAAHSTTVQDKGGAAAGAAAEGATSEAAGAAEGAAEGAAAEGTTGKPAAKPDWRDDRLRELTAKLKAEKAKNAANAGTTEGTTAAPAAKTQAEFDAAVQETAQRQLQVQQFNDACNAALAEGRTAFGAEEFDKRVSSLLQLVDMQDRASVANYQQFLQAALKAGNAKQLIFDLGSDLNEASRILNLSPIDMAVEMTKRAMTPPPNGAGTRAPRPASLQVGNHGKIDAQIDPRDPEKAKILPSAEWHSRRSAQRAEAHKGSAARFR